MYCGTRVPATADPTSIEVAGREVFCSASTDPEAVQDSGAEFAVIRISALVADGSPRSAGIDPQHVEHLVDAGSALPPILVHRPTMHIIDGFHRVAAAVQQGHECINAHLIDGPAEMIFAMAVQANAVHGLPLSLADRRSAAVRIINTHPHWSNGSIAEVTGLSAKTVRSIRLSDGDSGRDSARLGRDGRVRPINCSEGRAIAAALIKEHPHASLREIAAQAGISPNTVRDVRARMRDSDEAEVIGLHARSQRKHRRFAADEHVSADVSPVLDILSRDPALKMNSDGRNLLRWIHLHAVGPETAAVFKPAPTHCVDHLIDLAKRCAANWAKAASDLEEVRQQRDAI